jgi:hypothetical protein
LSQHVGVFSSKARTASETSPDFHNWEAGVGAVITIDCTAIDSSPSVVFTFQGKDPASGKYNDIISSAAITGTGTTVIRIHPELTAAANTIAKDVIPTYWRIRAVHADADSITYSVGVSIV